MIYLDHHATTPVDARVLERMLPYFCQHYGNASSRTHAMGWYAEEAIHWARIHVSALIGAEPNECVFTSGATESNHLAILGSMNQYSKAHVITQATEHQSVLEVCSKLEKQGHVVTVLPVQRCGRINLEQLKQAIQPDTRLISIMFCNNEIGTLQPISEIGALCKEHNILFHVDAAQGLGYESIHVLNQNIHVLSLSAHKMYGPKGVGALYVRRKNPRVVLEPALVGGGQEFGLRSGTLNVPGIVGLGEAARLALLEQTQRKEHVLSLRHLLLQRLQENLSLMVHGSLEHRHPGNLNIYFEGVRSEAFALSLRSLAVSSGSACASNTLEPSHVLRALGVRDMHAKASIRFGLGKDNTCEQIETAALHIIEKVQKFRR